VDLSASMLAHARRLNPEATYIQDDLRTVRLRTSFDAVITPHLQTPQVGAGVADAIDYMLTEADLAAAASFLDLPGIPLGLAVGAVAVVIHPIWLIGVGLALSRANEGISLG
jgi:Asp-tRNA(Asn)/Glu-tRNA(Gln) amidotransferase A subunit family amidase